MGMDDKARNWAEKTSGKAKEAVGDATDDRELETEGKKEKASGSLKQAGENIKDAFRG